MSDRGQIACTALKMQPAWLVGGFVALMLVQDVVALKILVPPGKTECVSQAFGDDAFQVTIEAPWRSHACSLAPTNRWQAAAGARGS